MHKILGIVGFILLMVGAAGMDSASLVIPSVMIVIGLGLLFIFASSEGWFEK